MSSNKCLLMDAGNSSIKLALAGKNGLGTSFELPTDMRETSDSLGLKILAFFEQEQIKPHDVHAWLIASVVPRLNPVIKRSGKNICSAKVYQVPRDLHPAITNRYDNPGELGADRLVSAFAARMIYPHEGIIVVDFGTATTFDCVIKKDYYGGLICPGLYSAAQSLNTLTARLPWFSMEEAGDTLEICRGTARGLAQGTVFGFAAMTDGLISGLKKLMPQDTLVVATGGGADVLIPLCGYVDELQPALLHQGLLFTAIDNKIL
ncbi:type III pantothenate kinase [Desulfonatronospira sp.]|uniref:type III pantothenate kinase n=1 Tax=Desulfonatronospira sp. TaxID=1962951 RepID=UPI0025C6278A|nr:type III pantothenate kinase [Desulfonatronospira sp.]